MIWQNAARVMDSVERDLRLRKKALDRLYEEDGYGHPMIMHDLGNAIAMLSAHRPAGICTYCEGDDNGCGTCRGKGWVTKAQKECIEAELNDEQV